ncbi:TrfB-related DNA-binding protein [Pseudomonas sp. W22_MBD1_FP4]|uniref:TrfB-related DNA-binding protein n=1 Tax=Pseudomonas sp. W22_MBD1_FP4 TaxID=3240272 RepID=UPI003F962AA6
MTTTKDTPKAGHDHEEAPTSLTAEEFEASKDKFFDLSLKSVELARLVLVEGKGTTAAGEALGMSKQAANGAMNRVRAALVGVPSDWVLYKGMMPKALAAKTRLAVEKLKQKNN